jgi:hypothetical protein
MSGWAESHKPGAAARTHLVLAALMWTIVGGGLVFFGARWSWHSDASHAPWLMAAALAAGAAKSRLILDRAGRRIVERILARGDGRCLGGFVSPPTWLLIVGMMALGRLLRSRVAPLPVGVLYLAVGSSLLISSRLIWQARRRARPPTSS